MTAHSGNEPAADGALSTVRLSDFGLRREPPRPLGDRTPDYEKLFDYDTLFYDVFQAPQGQGLVCLGPPLLNCEAALAQAVFRTQGSDRPMRWRYQPPRSHLQPSCRFWLGGQDVPADDRLVIELAGRQVEVPVRRSSRSRFAGRRVMLTLSKDNPLSWIRDWAAFNVQVHGADAVLFYDNGSTAYDPAAVRSLLETIPGLARILVLSWRFPYGPGTGPRNIQDSFYCQPGALEHARWRYCAAARGVLNSDIDELVATRAGRSIFERIEKSGKAAIVFPGLWVEKPSPPSQERMLVRHGNCLYRELRQAILRRFWRHHRLLRTKWIVVPERVPEDIDWGVHDLYAAHRQGWRRARSWRQQPRDLFYRHFRQINTGWKVPRWVPRRHSSLRHLYDWDLADAFRIAFPDQAIATPTGLLDRIMGWLLRRWRRNAVAR